MLGAAVADDVLGLVILTVVVARRRRQAGLRASVAGDRRARRGLPGRDRRRGHPAGAAAVPASSTAAPGRRARSSRSRSRSPSPSPSWPARPSWRPIVGAFVAGLCLGPQRAGGPHPARAHAGRPPLRARCSSSRSASTPTSAQFVRPERARPGRRAARRRRRRQARRRRRAAAGRQATGSSSGSACCRAARSA